MSQDTEKMTALPTREEVLAKPWWTTVDVMVYLGIPTITKPESAYHWMRRHNVRKSKTDRRLTCREWVDAALMRKS